MYMILKYGLISYTFSILLIVVITFTILRETMIFKSIHHTVFLYDSCNKMERDLSQN